MLLRKPSRGWLLSGFLILEAIGHIYGLGATGVLVLADTSVLKALSLANLFFIAAMVFLAILRLAFVVGIWFWHRWCFYADVACVLVGTSVAVAAGRPIEPFLYGFAGLLALYVLLRRARPGFISFPVRT